MNARVHSTLFRFIGAPETGSSTRENEEGSLRYTHTLTALFAPSPSHTHTAEEVEKWRKVSIAATGIVIVMSIKEMVDMAGGHHGAHSDKPLPDYMQIRAKPFPWECSSCSLFDTECFKKCKAERAGESVEDHH